jgi:hypothetical protein
MHVPSTLVSNILVSPLAEKKVIKGLVLTVDGKILRLQPTEPVEYRMNAGAIFKVRVGCAPPNTSNLSMMVGTNEFTPYEMYPVMEPLILMYVVMMMSHPNEGPYFAVMLKQCIEKCNKVANNPYAHNDAMQVFNGNVSLVNQTTGVQVMIPSVSFQ